jgi:hypothetical protein
MIKKYNGIVIRLEGNPKNLPILNHPSENTLDYYNDWDLVINTNKYCVKTCYEQILNINLKNEFK